MTRIYDKKNSIWIVEFAPRICVQYKVMQINVIARWESRPPLDGKKLSKPGSHDSSGTIA